jgi:dTDP-4-dehydrorhamnose reductase
MNIEKTKTRVAILGGRGMLGTDLAQACKAAGLAVKVYDLPEFDLCNPDHIREAVAGADVVVNCAAYTNVDKAEQEPELAKAVNATAVGVLGRIAASLGRYVLHISTDFVFDGSLNRPYRESDSPNPLSVYGATKLAGEQNLSETGCAHCIVRVQWTYGEHGNHFVAKFLSRAAGSNELCMVDDQHGAPTWTGDVAAALIELIGRRITGLFHFAAAGYATRYEVSEYILQQTNLTKNLRACKTAEFPAAAQRPLNSRFDCASIDTVLRHDRPHWQESMKRFLEKRN